MRQSILALANANRLRARALAQLRERLQYLEGHQAAAAGRPAVPPPLSDVVLPDDTEVELLLLDAGLFDAATLVAETPAGADHEDSDSRDAPLGSPSRCWTPNSS
uniref:Uncharacterized protein n=1 Tax=Cryptomonas curvata TaxID=233186 RepID=A0A6T8EBD1_9CRYP